MGSIHARVFKKQIDELLGKPKTRDAILRFYADVALGRHPQEFCDIVFQKPTRFGLTIYDSAACQRFLLWLMSGDLLCRNIYIGEVPWPDKEVARNRRCLARIASPFSTKLWCGLADFDGTLKWDGRVSFARVDPGNDKRTSRVACPCDIPLEVGYTEASRTIIHLSMSPGLARWPYGSKYLKVFIWRPGVFETHQRRVSLGEPMIATRSASSAVE